ncbi:methyltransferase family protein [Synechococcus sp. PCC 7502]|uniref:class I SAM-dependent methyltransferase n=1 Tax=Synechococcus sp. PCC 7502 TaxID=1173263 RepID=UPI00029FBB69|nr:class I SAM-dependent methyltransferase [Synechococcus sp. PCC 7502]AFY73677.1 methyltransferase family protein [Synechococcus sp. PCC 7502]
MNVHSCPVCQSPNFTDKWVTKNYKLLKCLECHTCWDASPDITGIYGENYYRSASLKGGYSNYLDGMILNSKTFTYRLNLAQAKLGNKGKLLDVGCALGDCLIQAKNLGWTDVVGIDVSQFAVDFAQKRGLSILEGDLTNHPFTANSFDLILLQDVIEHIANPIAHLQNAYHLLKPGGQILLITPDLHGLLTKILGAMWYHYKPNEHLTYFSQSNMKLALEKSGFVNIQSKPTVSYMSIGYVCDRLRFYQPILFSQVLKTLKILKITDMVLPFNIGEFEAWGQKPN